MHLVRFVVRLMLVSLWLVVAFSMLLFLYPPSGWPRRARMTRWWSRGLLRCCGVKTQIQGEPILDGPCIWIANHVSWIDIFYINQVRAANFISKDDVKSWPIIGQLVAGVGTIFIQRGNRAAVPAVTATMKERLNRNEVVAFFPEGTTTDGFDVLPFKKALFEPAINLGVPVQAIVLKYYWRGERSGYNSYIGDQSLAQNFWHLLGTSGVALVMEFLPPIDSRQFADRNALGDHMEHLLRARLKNQAIDSESA